MLIVVILNVIMIEINMVRVLMIETNMVRVLMLRIVKLDGIIMYCFAKSDNANCNDGKRHYTDCHKVELRCGE